MMHDKTNTDSGLSMRCNTPAFHRPAVGHPVSNQEASRKRSDLNLFEACIALGFKRFHHFAGRVRDLVNVTAPYFIHIVRANRARDMIGRCPGIRQTGQQDKQTVAG
tara:strand:- start:1895 stop:2215 length:321 start_codon:yes stop_codon:yes gene_type:complete